MKRQLSRVLLALALLAGLLSPALAADAGFTDVPAGHWANAYIQKAYDAGWVHGMGGGRYEPSGVLTRAQFLTMVTNAFFAQEMEQASAPEGAPWYAACWSVAQANGLHTGSSFQGLSDLPGQISRYDMAQVIVNTLSGQGISASAEAAQAAQSDIRDWSGVPAAYRGAVSGAYALGILNGRNGSFDGQATMTRAEAAAVLCRIDEAIANGGSIQTPGPDGGKAPDGGSSSGGGAPAQPTGEELTAEVVRLVNAERAKEGLAPLGTYDSLTRAAQIRAPEIVTLFSHDRPDGTKCYTAMDETGARAGAYAYGENIAAGNATAAATVEQWMNSPGHRANILNGKFTHIGVGYQHADGSDYGDYWVQMFVGTSSVPDSGSSQTPATDTGKQPDGGGSSGGSSTAQTGGLLFSCPAITLYPGGEVPRSAAA